MPQVIVYGSDETIPGIPASQMQGPGIYTITNGAISAFAPLPVPGTTQPGTFTPSYLLNNLLYVNVKDPAFGALGVSGGSSDDTAAFAKALAVIKTTPNSTLLLPADTYITDGFDLSGYANFEILGAGQHTTNWKLKNGANKSLLYAYTASIDKTASYGSASSTALHNFAIRNLTLFGNYLNQSGTSYVIQFYAVGWEMENVTVYNGFTGGIQCDYHNIFPSSGPLEARWHNVRVEYNNGIGVSWYGPSDSEWDNVIIDNSGSHNLHLTPNATGLQCSNSHIWYPGQGNNSVGVLCEGSVTFTGCESEGSDTCQLLVLHNNVLWNGGALFGGGHNGTGVQIGQPSGLTAYNGQLNQSGGLTTLIKPTGTTIDTQYTNINNANGIINVTNDGGATVLRGSSLCPGNTQPTIVGTPNSNDQIMLLAWDGTHGGQPYVITQGLGAINETTLYQGDPTAGVAATLTANTIYFVAVKMDSVFTITNLRTYFGSGGAGNFDLGIYTDNAGVPGTLINRIGSTATATGVKTGSLTPPATTANLAAGIYWLAMWINNATDTVLQTLVPAAGMAPIMSLSGTSLPSSGAGAVDTTKRPNIIGLLSPGWS